MMALATLTCGGGGARHGTTACAVGILAQLRLAEAGHPEGLSTQLDGALLCSDGVKVGVLQDLARPGPLRAGLYAVADELCQLLGRHPAQGLGPHTLQASSSSVGRSAAQLVHAWMQIVDRVV